ncbi:hypothetical protein BGX20_007277, partial [Mortierella sp. AD010]
TSDTTLRVESFTNLGAAYDIEIDFTKRSLGHITSCSCEYFRQNVSCCKHIALVQLSMPPMKYFRTDQWEHEENFKPYMPKPDEANDANAANETNEAEPSAELPGVDLLDYYIIRASHLNSLREKNRSFPQKEHVVNLCRDKG